MLGKLIKYDLKYGAKIFIILHTLMLISTIIGRFSFLEKINFFGDKGVLLTSMTFFVTAFILLYLSLNLGVVILIASRFYRNLFASEGYLTWTLPATPSQHLWSKIISGTIWVVLNLIISAVSTVILVSGNNVTSAYKHIAPEFIKTFGMDPVKYGWLVFCFALFCAMGSVIMIYLCIVLGQLFPSHRILASLIMYFIVTFIVEGITFAIMFSTNLFPEAIDFLHGTGSNMTTYLFSTFRFTAILTMILAIIEYVIIHYIMHRKINLT